MHPTKIWFWLSELKAHFDNFFYFDWTHDTPSCYWKLWLQPNKLYFAAIYNIYSINRVVSQSGTLCSEIIPLFASFSQTSSWRGIFWSQKTKDWGKLTENISRQQLLEYSCVVQCSCRAFTPLSLFHKQEQFYYREPIQMWARSSFPDSTTLKLNSTNLLFENHNISKGFTERNISLFD